MKHTVYAAIATSPDHKKMVMWNQLVPTAYQCWLCKWYPYRPDHWNVDATRALKPYLTK